MVCEQFPLECITLYFIEILDINMDLRKTKQNKGPSLKCISPVAFKIFTYPISTLQVLEEMEKSLPIKKWQTLNEFYKLTVSTVAAYFIKKNAVK